MLHAERRLRAFLCHASEDKPVVRSLHRRLLQDGFAPWLDEVDLVPGSDWQREIRRAVREADAIVICLSRNSVPKRGVFQREIRYALDAAQDEPEGSIFCIPLRLDDTPVPESLADKQWVNFYEEAGYRRLTDALHACGRSKGVTEVAVLDLSVLFCDIRGFTNSLERSGAKQVSTLLNRYYLAMTQAVTARHGVVTSFFGGLVMALFGAGGGEGSHPDDAVAAAVDMLGAVKQLNAESLAAGEMSFDLAIGINTGPMLTGIMGTGDLAVYTAFGDNVDLAARFQELNKEHRTRIIIPEGTRGRLSAGHHLRPLGEVVLKGKSKPIALFEVQTTQ